MRVLLIQPRVCAEAAYPLGLASLIPGLRRAGHHVQGLDLNFTTVEEAARAVQQADAVGVTVMTRSLEQVRHLIALSCGSVLLTSEIVAARDDFCGSSTRAAGARGPSDREEGESACRGRRGGGSASPASLAGAARAVEAGATSARARATPYFVLGGPHPTLYPRETLRQTGAHCAIAGDGEVVFPAALEALAADRRPSLAGVTWTDRLEEADPGLARVELSHQPFADREIFPIVRYSAAMRTLASPYTTMVTSRGCRRHCAWCPAPQLRPGGFEGRSPEHCYQELALLSNRYGIRSVHLEDDDPAADPDRFHALCERLVSHPLPLIWECVNGVPPERLEVLDLPLLARAGCRLVVISVEALHPGTRSIEIGYRLERVAALVARLKAHGIGVGGYFMLGMPEESWEAQLQTVLRSYRLGLDRANYSAFQWLPGSALSPRHVGEDGQRVSSRTRHLAALAHAGFYLQPRPFVMLLRALLAQPEVLPAILARIREQLSGRASRV